MSLGYRKRKKRVSYVERMERTTSDYGVDGHVLQSRKRRILKAFTRQMNQAVLLRHGLTGRKPRHSVLRSQYEKVLARPLGDFGRQHETTNINLKLKQL